MALYPTKYVVDKDWDSQQITDIVSYKGAGQNFTFGTDGFASIYETILDANDIKVPGAVGADPTTPSPVPYTGENRQYVYVVKGDFSEAVSAAANAKYTLDFQSIYGAPEAGDEDLRTKFVGSIVSEAANDVGIRVSSGEVFFGAEAVMEYKKDAEGNFLDANDQIIDLTAADAEEKKVLLNTNRTTITLNRTVAGSVGQWADSEFVVGGALAASDLKTVTATVTNTDLTVANWVWVGSQNGVNETASDAVSNFLVVNDSTVTGTTLQVRHTGDLKATNSTFAFKDMILRGDATFDKTTITLSTYISNVYGENNSTATLTLKNGSTLTSTTDFQIGKPDGGDDVKRAGALVLNASSIGFATVGEAETVITRSGNIAVKQNGSITMDAASKIYAGDIVNNGTINIGIDTSDKEDWIDAATFTNTDDGSIVITGELKNFSVKRVINSINAGEEEGSVDKADVNVAGITVIPVNDETVTTATAATRKGKVAVAAGVDYSTIYLSNRIDEDEDFAKAIKNRAETVSYYVDFNAFQLPKSALEEGVTADTKTILIDGGDRNALTYESEVPEYVDPDTNVRKNVIDGLTFAKDGTNAVAAVEDNPTTDEDETAAAQPELNVKFVLSGMDPTNPASYRELKKGITVEEGVTFTADKLYQSGKGAVTTINGELKMGTYATGLEDNPDTPNVNESVAPDTFQVAGGKVNVTSTGSLTGAGIVSVIATLRDDAGKPIKAEMNVTGAPINLSKLEIGANSTVTLTGIAPDAEGNSKAVFGNVVMRKTNVSDFDGPVLTIINSQVDVTDSFDTTKGLVNINFQSQLFVLTDTATIEGGTLNLTVTPEDVTLLSNYGKTDPETGELVVPQPELFYTIVHGKVADAVVLTCDGDKKNEETGEDGADGYIDGTKYVYTSLGGQGLFVMHEDVAKNLYVNAAWTNKEIGEVVGKGMFYGINAFETFTGALTVAKDNEDYATTITVLSDVTEHYNDDLFWKHPAPTEQDPTAKDPTYFYSNITVKSATFDATTGAITADPAAWDVMYVNDAQGRMDLVLSPAEGKTFTFEDGVTVRMGYTKAIVENQPVYTVTGGPSGIWLDLWGQGAGFTVKNDIVASKLVGIRSTANIAASATITTADLTIEAGTKTITVTGDPTATTAQITAYDIECGSGILNITDSIVNTTLLMNDDGNAVTGGSFVLNSDNTKWTISGDGSGSTARGFGIYYYKNHAPDADGNPTYTATFNFTNGSVVNTSLIDNVVKGASQDVKGTPMTINFAGSQLLVGSTVSNTGVITFTGETKTVQVESENPDDPTGDPIVTNQEVVVRSTASITGTLFNKAGGVITITDSTVSANAVDNKGSTAAVATITVGTNGVLSGTSVTNNSKGVLNVTGGSVIANSDRIYNYGTMNLNGAKFKTTGQKIQNTQGSTINIDGDVTFFDGEELVRGSITNYTKSGDVHKDAIINMGVSNTGTGAATVNVNINGGTVAFSADGLTFDMAVTGVNNAGTADEAIASAKLSGGTIFVDKEEITLTDSGFKVITQDAVADNPATEENEAVAEVSHMVWNDTNAIEIGAHGDLTLDKLVSGWNNIASEEAADNSLVVKNLTIAAGGSLTMDWSQCLTVNGTVTAAGSSAITVTLNPLEVYTALDTDKLVIADVNATEAYYSTFVKDYEKFFTVHSSEEAGFDVTGLYLDASKFVKVSQDHGADLGNGWYEQFNTVPGSQLPADQGAVESEGSIILGIDGTFEKNVFLKDKVTLIIGSETAPLTFGGSTVTTIFAGGFDVSAMVEEEEYEAAGPAKLNMKIHEGDTEVLISGGTFLNSVVIGGDLVKIDGEETKVNYYRVGDVNTVIDGGIFTVTSAGGQRMIVGGEFYQAATKDGKKVSIGAANLTGDINLTISGGSFTGYDVYAGNYANVKTFGKYAMIDGSVNLTLDSSDQALVFDTNDNGTQGGKIYAGSFGAGAITGDVTVTLTGDEDITLERLFGGCTGDIRKSTNELESNVEGNRILSFTGFTGDILNNKDEAAVIEGFDTVEFSDVNVLNFDVTGSFFNLDVTNWVFEADAVVTGNFAFDFSGDYVDLTDFTAENIGDGFTLSNVTFDDATFFAFDEEALELTVADGTLTLGLAQV